MVRNSARRTRITIAIAVAVGLGISACSGTEGTKENLPDMGSATVVDSPATSTAPAGAVTGFDRKVRQSVFDPRTGTLVMRIDDRLWFLRDGGKPEDRVAIPEDARRISTNGEGEVLVPAADVIIAVDTATGGTRRIEREGDWLTAVRMTDGRIVAGDADGHISILDADGTEQSRFGKLKSIDDLVVAGDRVVAIDRPHTRISAVEVDKGELGLTLRAGIGATTGAGNDDGRVFVADTTGNQLLVYSAGELRLHQSAPVPGSPDAIAWDGPRGIVWLTSAAENLLLGYDLSTGTPVERFRVPTVRQPDSLAVTESGDVVVVSGTGDGIQRITQGVLDAHTSARTVPTPK